MGDFCDVGSTALIDARRVASKVRLLIHSRRDTTALVNARQVLEAGIRGLRQVDVVAAIGILLHIRGVEAGAACAILDDRGRTATLSDLRGIDQARSAGLADRNAATTTLACIGGVVGCTSEIGPPALVITLIDVDSAVTRLSCRGDICAPRSFCSTSTVPPPGEIWSTPEVFVELPA